MSGYRSGNHPGVTEADAIPPIGNRSWPDFPHYRTRPAAVTWSN